MNDARVYQRALVRGWYWSGMPGLEDYIRDLGPSFERQRMLETLIDQRLTKEGPEALEAWLLGIPDEDKKYKFAAHRRLTRVYAARDPARAVAWCEAHCDGPYGDGLVQVIIRRWASADPGAAHEWLLTLPDGPDKTEAAAAHMEVWLAADADAVDAWMTSRGAEKMEPWMSTAITRYAAWLASTARRDYDSAIAWSLVPSRPKDQIDALRVVFRRWRQRDPEAADAWLASASLSDDQRVVLDKVAAQKRKTRRGGAKQAEPSA
jgi:DNA-binding GntR family transcriptional regulator